jgi:hypothetical protein
MSSFSPYYVVFLVALFMMISITNGAYGQCWRYSVNPELAQFGSLADNVGGATASLVR